MYYALTETMHLKIILLCYIYFFVCIFLVNLFHRLRSDCQYRLNTECSMKHKAIISLKFQVFYSLTPIFVGAIAFADN